MSFIPILFSYFDFIQNLDNFAKCHFYFMGCNLKGGPSNENFQAQQCAIMPDPGLKIGFQETTLENWQETATTVYHFSLFKIGSLCIVNHEQYSTYIHHAEVQGNALQIFMMGYNIYLQCASNLKYVLYARHYKPQLVYFLYPFFSLVYNQGPLILQTIYVLNKKI